jgi:hypothetical protein
MTACQRGETDDVRFTRDGGVIGGRIGCCNPEALDLARTTWRPTLASGIECVRETRQR